MRVSIVHPQFRGITRFRVPVNDFRLIILFPGATGLPTIPFVIDDRWRKIPAGQDVTTMGWGKTSEKGPTSDVFHEVEVDVTSNSRCVAAFRTIYTQIEDRIICALRFGKRPCKSDSGGPLIVRCDGSGKDVLVVVSSAGIGCAQPKFPGLYGRVSDAHVWFKYQMSKLKELNRIRTPPPITNVCGPPNSRNFAPVPNPEPAPTPFSVQNKTGNSM